MKKKTGFFLMLIILCGGLLSGCTTENQRDHCILLNGEQFPSIQAAINAANPGDTITVYKGTYNEQLLINKSITLQGIDPTNTIIDYTNNTLGTIITVTADNCKITGFTITNSNYTHSSAFIKGIEISSKQCLIAHNTISHISFGVYLINGAQNINISHNSFYNNKNAIELYHSSYNTITENNISSSTQFGVLLFETATYNMISSNTFYENKEAVRLKGNSVNHNTIAHNILINNDTDINQCCGARSNTIYDNVHPDEN